MATSQAAAVERYRELATESQKLILKISELEMDRNEHRLVEETLRPLDGNRRAYRLVGEVLVERSVAEVLPSVVANRENLETTIDILRERLASMQKEADEIKEKFNLQTDPIR